MVGWSLILEYSLAYSTVAAGWSGYLVGWIELGGHKRGVMAAAAIVFFAFYGFDAVATSALVLRQLSQPFAAQIIVLAAVIAMPSVILVMMYGQSRIFFVMARDGLLPRRLATVSKRTGSPTLIMLLTGLSIATVAGFFRLDEIAELANVGTLIAFISVGVCLMVLRRTAPQLPRLFRCPAAYVVGTVTVLGCLYLLASLPTSTLVRFVFWNAAGLALYFAYGRRKSDVVN